jgi:hypothetical protein
MPATVIPTVSTPPQAAEVKSAAVDEAVDHLLRAYHDYGRPSGSLSAAIVQNEKSTSDLYRASASLIPTPARVPDDETQLALFALRQARSGLRGLNACLSNVAAKEGLAIHCVDAKQHANVTLSAAFTQVFELARYGTRSRAELRHLVRAATQDQASTSH